jgi:hypothetical protein
VSLEKKAEFLLAPRKSTIGLSLVIVAIAYVFLALLLPPQAAMSLTLERHTLLDQSGGVTMVTFEWHIRNQAPFPIIIMKAQWFIMGYRPLPPELNFRLLPLQEHSSTRFSLVEETCYKNPLPSFPPSGKCISGFDNPSQPVTMTIQLTYQALPVPMTRYATLQATENPSGITTSSY